MKFLGGVQRGMGQLCVGVSRVLLLGKGCLGVQRAGASAQGWVVTAAQSWVEVTDLAGRLSPSFQPLPTPAPRLAL